MLHPLLNAEVNGMWALLVVSCGCEACLLSLKEECQCQLFEKGCREKYQNNRNGINLSLEL
jgi:hypothetical protein